MCTENLHVFIANTDGGERMEIEKANVPRIATRLWQKCGIRHFRDSFVGRWQDPGVVAP